MALKFLNDGYFAGKVGIGTESPTAKLHVSTGSSGATVYSGYNDMVIEGGNGASLSFLTPDANPVDINFGTPSSQFAAGIRAGYNSGTEFIAFKVVDSEKMRIIDTGNVGIGTASPTANLHVKTGSNTTVLIEGNQNTRFASLQLKNASQIWIPRLEGTTLDFVIRDDTASSEPFRIKPATSTGSNDSAITIDGNANVGIGTTSPDNRLDVVASDVNITPNTESSAVFRRNGNNYLTILSNASNEGGILFGNAVDANDGSVSYKHNTQSMQFSTADVERMRITSGGNVGIGTTSPASLLHIQGSTYHRVETFFDGSYTSGWKFSDLNGGIKYDAGSDNLVVFSNFTGTGAKMTFETQGSEKMRIDSSGNVGIGTTSPSGILHVKGSTDDTVVYIDTNNNALGDSAKISFNDRAQVGWIDAAVTLTDGGGNKDIKLKVATGSVFVQTNNTTRLTVADGGNVGIGTASPTAKLHVAGTGLFTGLVSGITPVNAANFVTKAYVDGSGGGTGPFLPLAGGTMTGVAGVVFPDAFKLNLGTGSDLEIYHNGLSGNNNIDNINGDLYMSQYANDKDIIFRSDNGSGGVEEYFRVDGSSRSIVVSAALGVYHNDGVASRFGNAGDLQIYHNATNSIISNATGNLYIKTTGADKDIIFEADDGSGGTVAEYLRLDGGITSLVASKDLLMAVDGNGGKIKFGASQDLQIYHDGTNSYIENDTGDLYIRSNFQDRDIILQSDNGGGGIATYIQLDGSTGAVDLNHYGSNKLKTTSTGVTVTDTVTASKGRFTSTGDASVGSTAHAFQTGLTSSTNIIMDNNEIMARNNGAVSALNFNPDGGDVNFHSNTGNTSSITSAGNATFAGNVTATNILTVAGAATGNPYLQFTQGGSQKAYIQYVDSGDSFELQSDNQFVVRTGGSTVALTINSSQNATFAGSVTIPNYIIHDSDPNTFFGFDNNDQVAIKTSGNYNFFGDSTATTLYAAGGAKLKTTHVSVGTATTAGGTLIDGWKTTTQANAINDTTIATTAYVNNKIGLIPAGLQFEGTWDASTGNPPSASPENGQFWIVSVAGSTSLSGITDWKVGDWAIYVVAGSGTDGWQKVDNSSVLDGFGTGQKVTKWDGSGTSNTLTDGPITFSSNDSTFAGDLYIPNKIIHVGDDNTWMQFETDVISLRTGGTDRLTLTNSTATFAGDITSTGLTVDYTGNRTGDAGILVTNDASDWGIKVDKDGTADYGILSQTDGENAIVVRNAAGTTKIQLQGDGDIIIPNGKINTIGGNNLTISGTVADHAGISFATNSILPCVVSATNNNVVDLGQSNNVFKNLYLGSEIISGGGATFAGKIIAGQGVQFTGGTIAAATTVLHTNNVVYARGGSGGMFLQNSDGSDGMFIANDHVRIETGSSEKMRIIANGNVGIGTTAPAYKLDVNGGIQAGGLVTYSKVAGSLSTTGYAVAGLTAGFNGASAGFEFKCYGSNSKYQRVVYSCHCSGTTWVPGKVIDEGTNDLDVVASANGATITFTFKARSSTQNFSPRIVIQATGHSINSTYA